MITDLLKWVKPGLVVALGSAALTAFVAPGNVVMAFEMPGNDAFTGQLMAQVIVQAPAPSGSITVLGPPRVSDYWVSATRQPGGVIVFDGYAPDDATRKALAAIEGADTAWLKLGSGAPAVYQPALEFGMAALAHMSEGRFALRSNIVTFTGIAGSDDDYEALTAMFAEPPASVILARSEITAPDATIAATTPEPVSPPEMPAVTAPTAEAQPATEAPVNVESAQTTPVEQPAPPAINPAYAFTAARTAGAGITMSGQAPTDPALRLLGVVAHAPTTGLAIADGAPADFIASAVAGLRALSNMTGGKLAFAGGHWSLSGQSLSAAGRATVLADIAALPLGADWSVDITVQVAIDVCRASVADFSARNAILFQSGAALIAPESEPALDELAKDLAACPDAVVHIEGHTDADGDEQLNLALSVARAEAVVSALVDRQITPARLYAVGYGESTPIADNDTAAGKRLNRRIVVSVLDEHY